MRTLRNKVAAITGAGSGIGRAVALLLAQHGCHVAISDVAQEGLGETGRLCRERGVKVSVTLVDVAERAAVEAWAAQVRAELGAVHVIVNNAGVALGATVEDTSYEDFTWLMNINVWGVVHGTRAFLPLLREAGEGHVINLSSVFGLVSVPSQSAYNAAKFAVKGFSDSLRQELEIEGVAIGVTTVHPGGIKTNIARAARTVMRDGFIDGESRSDFEKLFSTTAERAAQDIVQAILKNRRRQLIGHDARAIDLLQRALPSLYQRLVVAGGKRRRRAMLEKRP